jgi:O-antigen ligase
MMPESPVAGYVQPLPEAFAGMSGARRRARVRDGADGFRASYWFLLAFLILVYANTPFILPALDALRPAKLVAVAAILALLAETVFGKRSFKFALPEGAWLIAFLGAALLSCLTALWPGYAVTAVGDLLKMGVVFFFLVNCAVTVPKLLGIMWVIVISGLFPALGTLHHYFTGNLYEGRASWLGIFANPNEVAYSLVILLPLAAYLAWTGGWFARLSLLAISVLFLGAIFVTFSRGGLIGLAAMVEFFAWRLRSMRLQIVIVLLVAGGASFAGQHWSRNEKFSQLDNDVSFQQRIATSDVGLKMFEDHPLLGVGIACSVVAWPLYAPGGLYTRGALVTHNTWVQAFSEVGILGGVTFLILFGTALRRLRARTNGSPLNALGMAVEASIWGFIVCGLSGGYIVTWFPYILLGLAAATGLVAERAENDRQEKVR